MPDLQMKIERSREWWMARAAREGNHLIIAGVPAAEPEQGRLTNMTKTRRKSAPLISDAEAKSFYLHAEKKGIDPDGEGVRYSLIQPYDLQRLAVTVTTLRNALAKARAVIDAAETTR